MYTFSDLILTTALFIFTFSQPLSVLLSIKRWRKSGKGQWLQSPSWEEAVTSKSFLAPHYFLLWLRSSLWPHPTRNPLLWVWGAQGSLGPEKQEGDPRTASDTGLSILGLFLRVTTERKCDYHVRSLPAPKSIAASSPLPHSLTTPTPNCIAYRVSWEIPGPSMLCPKNRFHSQVSLGKVVLSDKFWNWVKEKARNNENTEMFAEILS